MKIAVCFNGEFRTALECAPHLKKFFSNTKHDIDFFIHTWDRTFYKNFNGSNIFPKIERKVTNLELDRLKSIYNPKGFKIESYDRYEKRYINKGLGIGIQHWYSFYKSIILKKWYERRHKFKYDLVIKLRLDCMFHYYDYLDGHVQKIIDSPNNSLASWFCYDIDNWKISLTTPTAHDVYFISKSEVMDLYASFFIKKLSYEKKFGTSHLNNNNYGYTQYMHTIFYNINPIKPYDSPFILKDAYKNLAIYELNDDIQNKMEYADGFYYTSYKSVPNGLYIDILIDRKTTNLDDFSNKVFLNE